MACSDEVLSAAEISAFVETGFLLVRSGIQHDVLRRWNVRALARLGYDPEDPATWRERRLHLPATMAAPLSALAPRLYVAVCQLIGGADRMDEPQIYDSFIVNLRGHESTWLAPNLLRDGWHIDGNNYRHFLDSPETGLVCLINWTAVGPRGGGTFIATNSLGPVARYLRARPEGVLPDEFDWHGLRDQCKTFAEPVCAAGDAVLMHPLMLHAASQNGAGPPRVLTNCGIALKRPLDFGPRPAEKRSPVELAVVRALGVSSVEFSPTRARQSFVAERTLIARRMLEEERSRGTA